MKENKLSGFINACLAFLGLPDNYSWVVRSGSGLGCHIIFRTEDIDGFGVSSLAYNPSSKFQSDFNSNFEFRNDENECIRMMNPFLRMELRWEDYLVLPPSIHKTGNKYEFFFNKIPSYSPMEVSGSNINNLLNYFCGEEEYLHYTYNGKRIYLARVRKTCAEYSSWTWKYEYKTIEDNIKWLMNCKSADTLNSLGIAYALGQGVQADVNRAKFYFEQSNNALAHFNLANLIACGYIAGNRADINSHLSFCKEVPDEYTLKAF